jgi:hypothetical protein
MGRNNIRCTRAFSDQDRIGEVEKRSFLLQWPSTRLAVALIGDGSSFRGLIFKI